MNVSAIPIRLQKYIAAGNVDKALAFMSKITAMNQNTLFEQYVEEYLRFVGQFRIQYLIQQGYYREALAWACLECELYPENNEVFAIKDSIRKEIRNAPTRKVMTGKRKYDLWGPVAGMRSFKAIIERDFFMPLFDPESYSRYKLKIPYGLLLYGPPGCGKTMIIGQMARIIGYNFIEILPSEIASTYVHGTQGKIREVFDEAINKQPTILYFDEFDALVPSRNAIDVNHHYASETSEFLFSSTELSVRAF